MRIALRIAGWGLTIGAFVAALAASMLMSELCQYDQYAEQRQGKADRGEGSADQVAVGHPRTVEPGTSGDEQAASDQQQRQSSDNPVCDLFRGTSATDRIVAVATLAYLTVTFWMWQAVRRQSDIAERSLIELERAWIIVEPNGPLIINGRPHHGDTPPALADAKSIVVNYTLTNYGRTPAWMFSLSVAVDFLPWPLPDVPSDRYRRIERVNASPIPPNKIIKRAQSWPALPGQRQMNTSDRQLVFYGRIEYRDIFRVNRETRFCMVVEPTSGDWFHTGTPAWNSYT